MASCRGLGRSQAACKAGWGSVALHITCARGTTQNWRVMHTGACAEPIVSAGLRGPKQGLHGGGGRPLMARRPARAF
eukprot:5373199-Pyramimonas_sp.AAC.1